MLHKEELIRQTAWLLHCSLTSNDKRVNIREYMPLLFEDPEAEKKSRIEHLRSMYFEIKEGLLKHGN